MWMRWCALAMAAGICCVVGGLGLAVVSQWLLVKCGAGVDACEATALARQQTAIALTLAGVIVSSLSTAAVAAFLMREKRPRTGPVPTVLHDAFPATARR